MMKPISDMTIDELRAELEQTRAALANMALLLEEAEASGKAARQLAKQVMRANRVEGAVVTLKHGPRGLRLVVCAPPSEREERLALEIGRWLEKIFGVRLTGEIEHVGVSES